MLADPPTRTKKKIRRRPAAAPPRGPQGLPGRQGPAPSQASSRPLIQAVARDVTSQPRVKKQIRRALRTERANLRISGDRPTRRTSSVDARKSPEYRAVLRHFIGAENHRLGYAINIGIPADVAVAEAKLAALRSSVRKGDGLYLDGHKLETADWRHPLNEFAKIAHAGHPDMLKQTAPVVAVMEQTTRPWHAIAAAADALATGRNIPHAALEGATLKDRASFSRVLRHVGAPQGVQALGGLALDIAADPTTRMTFGTSTAARQAAATDAKRATAAAAQAGASKKAADRAGRAAARKALDDPANHVKGLQVGFRARVPLTDLGIDVKSSGRATSRLVRKPGGSKVARKLRASGRVQTAGRELVHDFRPATRTPQQHAEARSAQRRLRAETAAARREGHREHKALRRALGGDDRRVTDAIESGDLAAAGDLAGVSREVRKRLGRAYDVKKSRGLIDKPFRPLDASDAQRYLPHSRVRDIDGTAKGGGIPVGRRKVSAEHGREIRQALAKLRADMPGVFSDDLARTVATHVRAAKERAALADFWQRIAKAGRPLTAGTHLDDDAEMVFRVTPRGLEPLHKEGTGARLGRVDRHAVAAALRSGDKHVILARADYEHLVRSLGTAEDRTLLGRKFDRLQGRWKWLVTVPLPSYHARNLTGDSFNAYLADTSAHSMAQATGVLAARHARNVAERNLAKGTPAALTRTVRINGRKVTFGALIAQAEKRGVIDQGFIGRELDDLIGGERTGVMGRAAERVQRASQYREDLPRLATFLSALKSGKSWEEAAEWSLKHHFDYGDLTASEQKLRRVFPFYTFWARNARLQATKVLTRPGKYATLMKVLDTAARASGFGSYDDYVSELKDYQQRGVPVPIAIDGRAYDVFLGLPAQDLNQLSVSLNDQAQNIANRLSAIKLAGELYANKSLFFQGDIENRDYPLVPAPAWADDLPDLLKRKLGVEKYDDPRRGRIWGWRAKVDYAARSLPESNFLIQQMTPVAGSRNQTKGLAQLALATGVKAVPHEQSVMDAKVSRLGEEIQHVDDRLHGMQRAHSDRDKSGFFFSKPYQDLLDERRRLQDQLDQARSRRGDRKLVRRRAQRRPVSPAQEYQERLKRASQADPAKEYADKLRKAQAAQQIIAGGP